MAFSPGASPGAGPSGARYPGARSQSPAGPATSMMSKRDKRRFDLQGRLQDLTATFSQNRDAQFRQQLHSLQCDMTLINNSNPYADGPLPDSSEDIAQLIEETVGGGKFAKEMASLSGTWYSKYVQEINAAKEQCDTELSEVKIRHDNNLERIARDYEFRSQFAAQEYKQLSATLRERLTQTINGKKQRLAREKDQLDIGDTNALLLHPNQFSITNPASPGGIHSNRKTRHNRHRVDIDELGAGITTELNKRKRKAPDEEPASPVRDAGGTTPAERNKIILEKQSAPTYSINSLFTDKELSAHANAAHVAAVHFFATSRRPEQSGTMTNGNNTDAEDTADGTGHEDNGTPAADMIRTASHNFHATRSTRGTAHNALSALADLADKPAGRPALPYHVLSNYTARPNGNAPPLNSLINDEVDEDLARMERLASKPAGWIDTALIEMVTAPAGATSGDGRVPLTSAHPDFPPSMGIQTEPLHPRPAHEFFPQSMERERSKRTRNH